MTVLSIIAIIIGLAGVAFGLRCYAELHKWARLCQNGRIVIAYNRRVQIDAPITEWVQWTRMLKDDERYNGRTIYRVQKMSVSILRPGKADKTTVKEVKDRAFSRLVQSYSQKLTRKAKTTA